MDSTDSTPEAGRDGSEPTPPPTAESAAPAPAEVPTSEAGRAPSTDGLPRRRRRRRRRRSNAAPSGAGTASSQATPTIQEEDRASWEAGVVYWIDLTPDSVASPSLGAGSGEPERPILRLKHRRRRRRRPAAPGLLPGTGTLAAEGAAAVAPEGAGAAPAENAAPAVAPGQRSFRAPRRRRRHAPLSAAAPAGKAESAEGAAGDDADTARSGQTTPPRSRNRRRRGAPPPGSPRVSETRETPEARPPRREHRPGQGERGARSRGEERRGPPRDRDRRGPPGRGRGGGPPRPAERKLYTFDSVVDRGFDDVEEETATRRVHWTIVKRTTADQISRKTLSALYVLQRDGVDSEFPSLGAARNAVNKTIVHPEKLTRSKAEHAAERTGKDARR